MGVRFLPDRSPFFGPNGWTPLALGASLLAWWDAERPDLITQSAGAVSSWRDIVGGYNLTQATGSAQPIWSATSFNGRPGVTPDGVDDYLELASGLSWLPGGAAPSEDWYAFDQTCLVGDAAQRDMGSWGSTNNSNSRRTYRVVSGSNRAGSTVNVTSSIPTTVDFSGRHVVRSVVTATGVQCEIDGTGPAEAAVVAATIATRLRMFANAGAAAALFGKGVLSTRLITGPLTTQQAASLRAWLAGRIVVFDADVNLWVAAVVANGGTVSSGRASVVETFIVAEKAAGTWALTDDYWGLWGENAPQALTSLKQRRLAVAVAAPTFTPDRDYTFNGTTQYLNPGFVPSLHGIAMTGSEQRLAVYERTNVQANVTSIGVLSGTGLYLRARGSATTAFAQMNTSAAASFLVSDSRGLVATSRAGGGTTVRGFRNGAALVDATGLTVVNNTPPAHALFIAALDSSGTATQFRAAAIGFACAGAPLSDAQEAAQYANVQAWATSVGANV